MKKRKAIAAAVLCIAALIAPSVHAQDAPAPDLQAQEIPGAVHVVIQTTLGNIRLALEAERAPVTTANFLRYVDAKRFDGVSFYRALPVGDSGEFGLVQAGLSGSKAKRFAPIAHESPATTGISHKDGTLSMARLEPGTATADFFIVIGDLTSLDGDPKDNDPGYAAFGHVVDGMSIVRQILNQPRDPNAGEAGMKGQMLAKPVLIVAVRRE